MDMSRILPAGLVAALLVAVGTAGALRHRRADDSADVTASLKDLLANGDLPELRAAAVVGLARTGDRAVLPLIIKAIEDDDPLVAGRAVGAAQHLLGVRYETGGMPWDRGERRRLAALARADLSALEGSDRAWWAAHTVQGATW